MKQKILKRALSIITTVVLAIGLCNCNEADKNDTTIDNSSELYQAYSGTVKDTKESLHRCQATTQKGTQCKRRAKSGSNYCWQHDK